MILDAIVASKRAEMAALPAPSCGVVKAASRDALARLRRAAGEPLRLVTEIKRKSPSAGPLSTRLSVAERARAYAEGGATMISVLCDGPFFDGAWEHVGEARRAAPDALILAKEFVVDPDKQVALAARWGADMLLAIVRIVDAETLGRIVVRAREAGIEPLVEITDERELATALGAGARVIGVNARDLDTLRMDGERAARVLAAIPDDVVAVHLSGLKGPDDVRAVAATRTDGVLVGEALMRQDDPRELLAAMAVAARNRPAP